MLAAIEEMGLRNPEAFCYHVEHLQSGRKWEVELYPSGEIESKTGMKKIRDTTKMSS